MSECEAKVRNLEASIRYLQEQHESTLSMLHDEINNLQFKNTELSFKIAMKDDVDRNYEFKDCNNVPAEKVNGQTMTLQNQITILNNQLIEKLNQIVKYQSQIDQLNQSIEGMQNTHNTQISGLKLLLDEREKQLDELQQQQQHFLQLDIHTKSDLSSDINKASDNNICIGTTSPVSSANSYNNKSPSPMNPIMPKTFKFRNHIQVHPESNHVKCHPIIARQTLISSSMPIKNSFTNGESTINSPPPDYAIAQQENTSYSQLIKQLTVLPPIKSSTQSSYPQLNCNCDNNNIDFEPTSKSITNQEQIIQIENVDQIIEYNNSALIYP